MWAKVCSLTVIMAASIKDESDALHARARAFVTAFEAGTSPEAFDGLARDIAEFQARHIPGYARLWRSAKKGALPFPAVPTDAFKVARVSVWDERETPIAFKTSGTTGPRGTHWFRTCATYDAGAVAFARYALGVHAPMPVIVIGPSPDEQPDSSLVHMIGKLVADVGTHTGERTYFIQDGILDLAALDERVAKLLYSGVRDILVLGTSLAYAHLLDALGEAKFRLPEGARLMQTGGFKTREGELDGEKLRKDLARALCIENRGAQRSDSRRSLSGAWGAEPPISIDARAIVSEYGMTELSSQFWEMTLLGGDANVYVEPPWARVIPVDAETLEPASDGEVGLARIEDLLNVDSAVAIVTADRVRRVISDRGGFELLGRTAGAPPRGCSIATEEMLRSASD